MNYHHYVTLHDGELLFQTEQRRVIRSQGFRGDGKNVFYSSFLIFQRRIARA